jgi:hypothetical protein
MARRRMIDPNFWESDDVGNLSMFERLLVIGLFSTADDYGKGRGNPATIRSKIFPNDDVQIQDIEKAIENIQKHVNIIFYIVDGNRYYKFLKWSNWQRVDKPQDSILPEPDDSNNYSENDSENSSENDSCLKEEKRKEIKREEKGKEEKVSCSQIVEWFNEICVSYPKVTKLTDSRRDKIRTRLKEVRAPDVFKQIFQKVEASDFMKGNNKNGWKATFDWLIENDSNYTKVLEGNYDNKEAQNGRSTNTIAADKRIIEKPWLAKPTDTG